jgi:hypothetical protein
MPDPELHTRLPIKDRILHTRPPSVEEQLLYSLPHDVKMVDGTVSNASRQLVESLPFDYVEPGDPVLSGGLNKIYQHALELRGYKARIVSKDGRGEEDYLVDIEVAKMAFCTDSDGKAVVAVSTEGGGQYLIHPEDERDTVTSTVNNLKIADALMSEALGRKDMVMMNAMYHACMEISQQCGGVIGKVRDLLQAGQLDSSIAHLMQPNTAAQSA